MYLLSGAMSLHHLAIMTEPSLSSFAEECCPMSTTSKLVTTYNTVSLWPFIHEMGALVEPLRITMSRRVWTFTSTARTTERTGYMGWQVHEPLSVDTPGE